MELFERTPSPSPSSEESHRIELRATIEWNISNDSTIAPEELQPQPAAGRAEPTARDDKKSVTFGIRTSLNERAQMAVLRTGGYEGGYISMAALLEGALERELKRLAIEFNNGEPFPPNAGGFRQGRPLGS
ncbi:hypothetical protein [Cryobacterium tagatosivorans]|jgi:hypothetical protein|uniref:Centromere-binding protein ParB C-terminal domain-containing protein n=1 Tax=Cryobacterium tagatosivorans TaxID=1259199 RepID=A0A4V6QG34_9MICO|nr:hypothetical protein [Cryobacterium tagatosivorans]TFB53630.1 hypothetical protein E3O23_04700 [Cryobacterium tagatosivorans]